MEIKTRQSNYSFLSIRVTDGNVSIDTEIYEEDLRSFAIMLIDVADDALSKIGDDADSCQRILRDCYRKLCSNDWKSSVDEEDE